MHPQVKLWKLEAKILWAHVTVLVFAYTAEQAQEFAVEQSEWTKRWRDVTPVEVPMVLGVVHESDYE